MSHLYLGLLDTQTERLAAVADVVRRVVVLLAPLPPNLGDILVRKREYLRLGYYRAAVRAAVQNVNMDRREGVQWLPSHAVKSCLGRWSSPWFLTILPR
jgi:hypothetical protein